MRRYTKAEIRLAYEMRKSGSTWQAIADTIGGGGIFWCQKIRKLYPDISEVELEVRCQICGIVFQGDNVRKYCSDACAKSAERAQWARRKKSGAPESKVCAHCKKTYVGNPEKPNQAYCGKKCRLRATKKRQYWERKVTRTGTCPVCGTVFESVHGGKPREYCSDVCYRKSPKTRDLIREARHRRRARKVRAFVAPVYFKQIALRDGWRCQICGKPVKKNAKAPHPLSPSLDHIIPLAKGGTHEPKNAQLAHLLCNATKSDKGGGQLRLFG